MIPNALDLGLQIPHLCLMVSSHAGLCQEASNLVDRFLLVPSPLDLYLVMSDLAWLGVVTPGHVDLCQEVPDLVDMGVVIGNLQNPGGMSESHEALCLMVPSLADLHQDALSHADQYQAS